MTREEAWNRIDAIIEKHEVDDVYVTINNHKDYDALRFARKLLEQEPCEDVISRQAAIDTCLNIYFNGYKEKDLLHDIKNLPPVNPEPKTGHWIEKNINEWSRKVFCSECGCPPPFEYVSNGNVYLASGYGVINKTRFCPSCGCRMIEPQESEKTCNMYQHNFESEHMSAVLKDLYDSLEEEQK